MNARQCSRRGGILTVTVPGDSRVQVAGNAVVVLEGNLLL